MKNSYLPKCDAIIAIVVSAGSLFSLHANNLIKFQGSKLDFFSQINGQSNTMVSELNTKITFELFDKISQVKIYFMLIIFRPDHYIDMDRPCLGEVYDGIDSMIEDIRNIINEKEQDPDEMFFKELKVIMVERWNKMTTLCIYLPLH